MKPRLSAGWCTGLLFGAAVATACGETSRRPTGAGHASGSGGTFPLPIGGTRCIGEAGRGGGGSGSAGGSDEGRGGAGGEDAEGGAVPGGAPNAQGGEVNGGAGGDWSGGAGGEGGEPSVDCPDPLVFADPLFEEAVRKAAQLPAGPVARDSVSQVTALFLDDDRIISLGGAECLPSLRQLDISASSISSLEPLARKTTLRILRIVGSPIQSLAPLGSLTQLQSLELRNCGVEDISPLAPLVNLESLDVGFNAVKELQAVSGMTNLISLGISRNRVVDLSPLTSLQKLDYLYMWGNAVADLAPLAQLAELDTLHAEDNLITSLAPLAVRFHGYVNLAQNRISDFSPLLSFANPMFTSVVLQYQHDENGDLVVDCAAQSATIPKAKNLFSMLLTDCPPPM